MHTIYHLALISHNLPSFLLSVISVPLWFTLCQNSDTARCGPTPRSAYFTLRSIPCRRVEPHGGGTGGMCFDVQFVIACLIRGAFELVEQRLGDSLPPILG